MRPFSGMPYTLRTQLGELRWTTRGAWTHILHNDIVSGNTVGGHEQERFGVDLVQISHLARGKQRQSSTKVRLCVSHDQGLNLSQIDRIFDLICMSRRSSSMCVCCQKNCRARMCANRSNFCLHLQFATLGRVA